MTPRARTIASCLLLAIGSVTVVTESDARRFRGISYAEGAETPGRIPQRYLTVTISETDDGLDFALKPDGFSSFHIAATFLSPLHGSGTTFPLSTRVASIGHGGGGSGGFFVSDHCPTDLGIDLSGAPFTVTVTRVKGRRLRGAFGGDLCLHVNFTNQYGRTHGEGTFNVKVRRHSGRPH